MKGQGNATSASKISFWNNPKVRSVFIQVVMVVAIILIGFYFYTNTVTNLAKLNMKFGFDFLGQTAGFDIIQKPISYSSDSTFRRALQVGAVNTLIVSALGIIFATIIGFVMGIMRLSKNWLVSRIAMVYVETVRNIPLLLQILVWYMVLIKIPPDIRNAWHIGSAFFSQRGILIPKPIFEAGAWIGLLGLGVAVVLALVIRQWARRRQMVTGHFFPYILTGFALIIGLPLLFLLLAGWPVRWDIPELKGFNFVGGLTLIPEFTALLIALSVYTGAFITEIVRAGVQAVSRGQTEAAFALGLRPGVTTRLIIIPQAMRIIIPPLTSQFLNLTKNSSLAIAIGFPEIMAVGGTVNNQTGKAIEVALIWMGFYLTLSLLTSAFMNWFNARVRLVER